MHPSSNAPGLPAARAPLLLVIGALTLIDFLQNGMVTFAAAPIMGEIGASPEEYSTIAVIYACVAVVMIALQGWLVHRLGLRRYLLASLAAAAAGAAVCALSRGGAGFLCGRVLMAVGCAAMLTSSRLSVDLIPPGPARFHGIKALATGLCVGTALAPWLASMAVNGDGWPMMFWLVAALSLLAMIPVELAMPGREGRAALAGQARPLPIAALGIGSFLVLHALQRSYYDFFGDRHLLALSAAAGIAALGYFVRSETRNGAPLLKLGGMKEARFLCGLGLFMVCYLMLGANGYLVPLMLQRALGQSWSTTGEFFAMGLGAGVLTWAAMSQLLPRWPSPRKFFVAGFLALAAFGAADARRLPVDRRLSRAGLLRHVHHDSHAHYGDADLHRPDRGFRGVRPRAAGQEHAGADRAGAGDHAGHDRPAVVLLPALRRVARRHRGGQFEFRVGNGQLDGVFLGGGGAGAGPRACHGAHRADGRPPVGAAGQPGPFPRGGGRGLDGGRREPDPARVPIAGAGRPAQCSPCSTICRATSDSDSPPSMAARCRRSCAACSLRP
jgi:MFS family permease